MKPEERRKLIQPAENPLLKRDELAEKVRQIQEKEITGRLKPHQTFKRVETRTPFQIVLASFMGLRHGVKWGCPSEKEVMSRAAALGFPWPEVEREYHEHYQRCHELEYALDQTPEDQIIELELDYDDDKTIWRGVKDRPYWMLPEYWELKNGG